MTALDEPSFYFFESFGLEFLNDELLTKTDWITEQTESGKVNDETIDNFITVNKNKSTIKKTQKDLHEFYRWAKSVNETRTLDNIPGKELDNFGSLFENIGKQNGDEYEPNTLTSILRSFDRFLRDKEWYFWRMSLRIRQK